MLEKLRKAIDSSLGDIGASLKEMVGAKVKVSMTSRGASRTAEITASLAGSLQVPFCLGEATRENAVLIFPQGSLLALAARVSSSDTDELTEDAKATLARTACGIAEKVARSAGAERPQIGQPVFDSKELGAGLSESENAVEFRLVAGGGTGIEFSVVASPHGASETGAEAPEFVPFDQPTVQAGGAVRSGIDLILDVPLEISVELGRVSMLIKDILGLAPGSIVELNRTAGEPVDLLVNGRLVAKGEVVVIEDNFGIRVTEIISPADTVAQAGELAS